MKTYLKIEAFVCEKILPVAAGCGVAGAIVKTFIHVFL